MRFSLPYKTKQFFVVLIKLSIVVGAFYFIYHKITYNDNLDFNGFVLFLKQNRLFTVKNGLILLSLSFLNWFLEIKKWQFLVSNLKKLSFLQASAQCLGSLTASLITPNRIGEYGAKAMYYKKSQRKQVVFINLIGNLMQLSITILVGSIGLILFYKNHTISLDYFNIVKGLLILLTFTFFVFFILQQTKYRLQKIDLIKIKNKLTDLGLKHSLIGLTLSLLRYLIFSFQFYYILKLFNVNLDYLQAMTIISSMYLLASIIPTISVFDVVIKGSIALYLFGLVNVAQLPVLSCILLMWILNFAIPSLVGCYYVLKFDLIKN
ncbi:hypothetical protein DZC78_08605 [Olleya aquimaris]|uniref:Flippase-like domain-containing protein n=1 Tax=Olleya sediminilitoris TaxID=2795739 RepID=A0ABS1WMA0_9FLAO|nr:lysylphosphatidylglycerol synthase domain-containing protein [Olleya sediminilitoris]AXO80440.1 hypothetical protein DZC78_08605 [Olleya aquimaris]MBL7560223.1 flippase-like domain-containing protein [Olleya sediminilitoris]